MKSGFAIRLACMMAVLIALVSLGSTPASAQAIVDNGAGVAIGIDLYGQMNVPAGLSNTGTLVTPYNSTSVGLSFFTAYGPFDPTFGAIPPDPKWGDATSPGCLCEGYGISTGLASGYANNAWGVSNLDSLSFASGLTTITTETRLTSTPDLHVKHAYAPSLSPALYEAKVTLSNVGGGTLTDVRYNRTMDWDIPPTTFSEYVTIQGWPATNLFHSSNNGFNSPDPLVTDAFPCCGAGGVVIDGNFTDADGADHGARFTFKFGDLGPGDTKTFSIFYGAAASGELGALAALSLVGAEVYSLGQSSPPEGDPTLGTPATFIFGFKGVGGTPVPPVPEPGTLLLLGIGLLGGVVSRRSFKR